MKKVYMKPLIEGMNTDLELQILKGSWNNHADSKQQDVFEDEKEDDPALDHVKNIGFPDIWGDEEED